MSALESVRSMLLRARAALSPRRPRTPGAYVDHLHELAAAGRHRAAAGGLWDEVGELVTGYLIGQGLRPTDRLLDIGCGPLRIGLPLIDYLDPGNYYGVDAVADLIAVGYQVELADAGLQHKLPEDHLLVDEHFDFAKLLGDVRVDAALAQSLFTHLPITAVRNCLTRLAGVIVDSGVLHATFFLVDEGAAARSAVSPGGVVTFPDRDPFHHTWRSLAGASAGLPWSVERPVDIAHPRGQVVVRFTRHPIAGT